MRDLKIPKQNETNISYTFTGYTDKTDISYTFTGYTAKYPVNVMILQLVTILFRLALLNFKDGRGRIYAHRRASGRIAAASRRS